ncbi:MAG: hypothetical protein QNJ97_14195 [Myxococcota bacterium]|nr:hypothetical protein [Myxococcota bacterium]
MKTIKKSIGMALAAACFALSSCAVPIGSNKAYVRAAPRMPTMVVPSGGDEYQMLDILDPEEDTLFLVLRGRF